MCASMYVRVLIYVTGKIRWEWRQESCGARDTISHTDGEPRAITELTRGITVNLSGTSLDTF